MLLLRSEQTQITHMGNDMVSDEELSERAKKKSEKESEDAAMS